MLHHLASASPNFFAKTTQSSMVTFLMGMKGTTSTAPMRGCCPLCSFMSMSSMAAVAEFRAAEKTEFLSPTKVTTSLL